MAIGVTSQAGRILKRVATDARARQTSPRPVHLLLALLDDEGVAGRVLRRPGADHLAGEAAAALAAEATGLASGTSRRLVSASGRPVLGDAEAEARRVGSGVVGTEHLLGALLYDDADVTALLLRRHGIDRAAIDAEANAGEAVPASRAPAGATPRVQRLVDDAHASSSGAPADALDLLIAIVEDGDGIGAQVLRRRGVDAEVLSAARRPRPGAGGAVAERILVRAADEARRRGHGWVGTEHVLLAVIEDASVARLLASLDASAPAVRADLEAAMAGGAPREFPGHPKPWTSRVVHDADGHAILRPNGSLVQYFIDAQGRPVRDRLGRRIHWRTGDDGGIELDESGNPILGPID
jgi:ATP-dependent Clp protease ATP-binding subunit ClpA